ncbi:hypothetical protein [Aliikangiella sp. IMCC44359]|uniref:hypothetical protein n=1 Tax=Aliikangiella sp. IMCC44359 TaxID=3459125 RepID=UPI00403A89ED
MQMINHWPEKHELALPEKAKVALLNHLIEPFGDETAAKEFWSEYSSTIFIISKSDNLGTFNNFDDVVQQQIGFALANPEYCEPLTDLYTISLSIINDEGSGIYLVINKGSEISRLNRSNED